MIYINLYESIIQLSQEHQDAVNRRRTIVVKYDANGELGDDFIQWIAYRVRYIDEPETPARHVYITTIAITPRPKSTISASNGKSVSRIDSG